jgi:hypothetical protein
MAKRWIVLLLAVAVALAVVPLATAGPGGGWAHGKKKFNLVGTVVPVPDPTGPLPTTLTVYVKAGTKTVRAARGANLTINVDPAARVRLVKIGQGCVDGTLADLVQGMKVKVRGTIDRTDPNAPVFTAKWIKAKTMPTPEPSSPLPSPAP